MYAFVHIYHDRSIKIDECERMYTSKKCIQTRKMDLSRECKFVYIYYDIYYDESLQTHEKDTFVRVHERIFIDSRERSFAWTNAFFSWVFLAARKASWNPAGVEPVHWKPADINPGALKWVKIKMHVSSELMVQIKQKGVHRIETPLPRSFLGGSETPLPCVQRQMHTDETDASFSWVQIRIQLL